MSLETYKITYTLSSIVGGRSDCLEVTNGAEKDSNRHLSEEKEFTTVSSPTGAHTCRSFSRRLRGVSRGLTINNRMLILDFGGRKGCFSDFIQKRFEIDLVGLRR